MKCSVPDCPHEASHVPQLFVPATGWPQEEATAINMILSAPMCRRHCESFKVSDLIDVPNEKGATLREVLIPAIARMSGSTVPPDCDRAWITPLRLNSDAYRSFVKAQGGGS